MKTQIPSHRMVLRPVVDGQADIFCTVLQSDVGVFRAELDVLAAGVGHREGQSHGLELLGRGLVVPDVHQTGNKIFIDLQSKSECLLVLFTCPVNRDQGDVL